MKRLVLLFTFAFLGVCSGCGAFRSVPNRVPASYLVGGGVPQDTIVKVKGDSSLTVKPDSSATGLSTDSSAAQKSMNDTSKVYSDSLLRAITLRDSLIRDSIIRDSIIRDSIVRDSLEKVAAMQEPIRYDFSPVYQTDVYVPSQQNVPSGEYSGITYLGGNRYAVVHDKLKGGGIVFFDIAITNNGKVASAKATVPAFTSNSKVSGRDNEGVAFVPAASSFSEAAQASESGTISGTLFVSAESNQSIVEYTLEGKETGRSLKIPSAFGKDKINSNNGFEALTYNALTKTFWTTTETPLKADGKDSRLLRLQSFGSNLKAAKQYLYKMDSPVKSAAEASAAKAYVHGVPALVALDDGSLIVLEREVYVPNGGLFAKALGSFTRTLLYVVTPGGSSSGSSTLSSTAPPQQSSSSTNLSSSTKASALSSSAQKSSSSGAQKSSSSSPELLEKRLLVSFSTSSLNLANYEGMCLGPELPGGWHTLILIADSQGGSSGLTSEYIKVLVFR